MGQLAFGKARGRTESSVVRLEFDGETNLGLVQQRVLRLSELLKKKRGLCCYVLGDGGMPAGTYKAISKNEGVKVVAHTSLLPSVLFFLRSIIASECGLVKLEDVSALPRIFSELIEQTMAIIFVFPSDEEEVFVGRAGKRDRDFGFDYGVRAIENHLIYLVDADNAESRTGVAEYFSCGISCDDDLVEVFNGTPRKS